MPTFVGPTVNMPFAPPLQNWHYPRGQTVWRLNGVWSVGNEFPWGSDQVTGLRDADRVPQADYPGGEKTDGIHDTFCFLGGRTYTVSTAVAAVLTTAGYGAYLT